MRHQMQHLFDFYCLVCKQGVAGSNPATSTKFSPLSPSLTLFLDHGFFVVLLFDAAVIQNRRRQ